MKTIDGVGLVRYDASYVFLVERFSDELKNAIRDNLTAICHGPADAATGRTLYSYKTTLSDFIKRCKGKKETRRIGLIGELLVHVLLHTMIEDYTVSSPFFNLEEGNVKKGFDVVLLNKETHDLWITEVKSGQIHKEKTSTETMIELINTAKLDLKKRLNENKTALWLNAIHGAKKVLENSPDEKNAVVAILQDMGDAAADEILTSNEANVMLVGTLFHQLSEKIDSTEVPTKREEVKQEGLFKDVIVVAIQKETYSAVYEFLEQESKQ